MLRNASDVSQVRLKLKGPAFFRRGLMGIQAEVRVNYRCNQVLVHRALDISYLMKRVVNLVIGHFQLAVSGKKKSRKQENLVIINDPLKLAVTL